MTDFTSEEEELAQWLAGTFDSNHIKKFYDAEGHNDVWWRYVNDNDKKAWLLTARELLKRSKNGSI